MFSVSYLTYPLLSFPCTLFMPPSAPSCYSLFASLLSPWPRSPSHFPLSLLAPPPHSCSPCPTPHPRQLSRPCCLINCPSSHPRWRGEAVQTSRTLETKRNILAMFTSPYKCCIRTNIFSYTLVFLRRMNGENIIYFLVFTGSNPLGNFSSEV